MSDTFRRMRPFVEPALVLLLSFGLAVTLHLPTLWLLVPLCVIVGKGRPLQRYGLTLKRPGSVTMHVAVSAAVFLPYVVVHYLFEHYLSGASLHPQLPAHFAWQVVEQTLVIALPEEFFFRGYLQTELDRILGRPWRVLGARVGVGLIVAAALFALCHTPFGGPTRLSVFFPGLLYGWLRARTGTIAVPTAYHAASNLLMSFMVVSLR